MAAVEEESPKGNEVIIPNDLDQSVDSQTNLTIRLTKDSGRKCYVDPHEAFPQATYYLNHNLKRPNYYLKKEKRFNRKILIQQNSNLNQNNDSLLSSPSSPAKKRRKKKTKNGQSANSKMEVDSDSDDDDDTESEDEEEEEEEEDDDAFNGDDHEHFADDELFSDGNNALDGNGKSKNVDDNDHRNFLNIFPKRNDEDQKSDSYELDADKLAKLGKGQRGFSDEDLSPLAAPLKRKRKKFGAWDGGFVSCLLNIFGVIMFLRLGFVVGQAGLWYTFLIILLSSVVTTLTTLSMAAIATNGEQRAGYISVLCPYRL